MHNQSNAKLGLPGERKRSIVKKKGQKKDKGGSSSFHSFHANGTTKDASSRFRTCAEETSNGDKWRNPPISSHPSTHIHLQSNLLQPPDLWNYAWPDSHSGIRRQPNWFGHCIHQTPFPMRQIFQSTHQTRGKNFIFAPSLLPLSKLGANFVHLHLHQWLLKGPARLGANFVCFRPIPSSLPQCLAILRANFVCHRAFSRMPFPSESSPQAL